MKSLERQLKMKNEHEQSINQSIKTNIFPCLIKDNVYYSATVNIYLHVCDKLSLHFTD